MTDAMDTEMWLKSNILEKVESLDVDDFQKLRIIGRLFVGEFASARAACSDPDFLDWVSDLEELSS